MSQKEDRLINKYKTIDEVKSENKMAPWIGLLFFTIFFLLGLGFSFLFAMADIQAYRTKSWIETSCKVISSKIKSEPTQGDPYEYSNQIIIVYEYFINDVKYQSDNYGFTGSFTSDGEEAKQIISQYPVEKNTVCYVNPANPKEAVLKRDWKGSSILFAFLLCSPFTILGFLGILWMVVLIVRNRASYNGHYR